MLLNKAYMFAKEKLSLKRLQLEQYVFEHYQCLYSLFDFDVVTFNCSLKYTTRPKVEVTFANAVKT